jgi:aldehyde dehydrogenase (NAD+)/betaine-aldehyde dehydrogenase
LAAGCSVVLLASPQAPLATLMLGQIAAQVGFPAGVLNVIVGGPEVGRRLTEHPDVAVVTFTGSVPVGRMVMAQAASHIARVVLELGGKSAAILLPGADFDAVVGPLHQRYARNAGQGCASPTRLLVPANRMDDFIDLSRAAYERIVVGDPFNRDTLVGPLISSAHRARVEGYVQSAVDNGGFIAAGGGRPPLDRGWFVNPCLVAGVPNSARISQEEVFGPVAVVLPYTDVNDAVRIANDSTMGLHAMIFGPLDEALDIAPRLAVGQVTINGGGSGSRTDAPMGGFKQSGIGREAGRWGLSEFLQPQHVHWPI